MHRTLMTLILSIWLSIWTISSTVWGADDPGMSDDTNLSSTAGASEVTRGYLANETVGIKPQLGLMVFTDQNGNSTSRAMGGFTVDGNIATMIDKNWNNIFIGPSSGFLFSHLGQTGSNFVGTSADITGMGDPGSNIFLIPANLKLGYNITDNLRVAGHGGGNVTYRSVANSLNLGASSSLPGSVWRIFPNVGGDLELGLGKHAALMLRPDWTLTPGDSIFTGTIAFNFPIT